MKFGSMISGRHPRLFILQTAFSLKTAWSVWLENRLVRRAFAGEDPFQSDTGFLSDALSEVLLHGEAIRRFALYFLLAAGSALLMFKGYTAMKVSSTYSIALPAPAIPSPKAPAAVLMAKTPDTLAGPALNKLPKPIPGDLPLLIAQKRIRQLTLYRRKGNSWEKQAVYEMNYGRNDGPKRIEGDLKTPEGNYWITDMTAGPNIGTLYGALIFKLNFPNEADGKSGFTGSGIWIHGSEWGQFGEPTKGCLKLKNPDILALAPDIRVPMPVMILSKEISVKKIEDLDLSWINEEYAAQEAFYQENRKIGTEKRMQIMEIARRYVEDETNAETKTAAVSQPLSQELPPPQPQPVQTGASVSPEDIKSIAERIEKWKTAWAERNIGEYSRNFHSDFTGSEGRNKMAFIERKQGIFDRQDSIYVDVGSLEISPAGDSLVRVGFRQNYRAFKDGRLSFGKESSKDLVLKKAREGWLIIRE